MSHSTCDCQKRSRLQPTVSGLLIPMPIVAVSSRIVLFVPSYLIIYVNIMQCQCVLTSYFIICAPVAVIKYWGKHDVKLNTPMNSSASLTLDQVVHASLVAWICIATLCITIAFFIMNIIHTNTRLIQNIMSLDNDDGDNDDDAITESVYIYTLLICRRIFTQSRQLLQALTTRPIACG
jgi:hypothetical protein